MRDYTSGNYCDFLWISDLLGLKKNASNVFSLEIRKGGKSSTVIVSNATIFGTIVEVKQIRNKEFLYRLDDGTGVIACKHNEEQFEETIRLIETENVDILNQTSESRQELENSCAKDISADDSVFNDRSIQLEEINFNKTCKLKFLHLSAKCIKNKPKLIKSTQSQVLEQGLQSIWDDIYKSFYCLIKPYAVGDTVVVQGKLYTYFNENQIYVNSIRTVDITEEMMLLTIKLENDLDESLELSTTKAQPDTEKRLSGLMTFDNIPHLSSNITNCRNIETPKPKYDLLNVTPGIVTPNLESTVTFDTFASKM